MLDPGRPRRRGDSRRQRHGRDQRQRDRRQSGATSISNHGRLSGVERTTRRSTAFDGTGMHRRFPKQRDIFVKRDASVVMVSH
jgi:hypothetical protein